MLVYTTQASAEVLTAVALTSSYTNNSVTIASKGMSKLSVYTNYARGAAEAASKMFVSLEASHNGTDWFSLVIDETATTSVIIARTWEIGSTSKLNIILDIAYPFMKLSVKETGVVTNVGTATVAYTLSGL